MNYHADGMLDYYVIYEYDAAGNQTGQERHHADGSLDEVWIYHEDGSSEWGIVRPDGSVYWVE